MKSLVGSLFLVSMLVACGPTVSDPGAADDAGDDDTTPIAPDAGPCVPTGETETVCNDSVDSDCDGDYDCNDLDCSGIGECPVCGEATHAEGQPLALPDDGSCTNDYVSTIAIHGFATGQTIQDMTEFLGVCVTMEHSWLRDLQIELHSPNGTGIILQEFLGATCGTGGGCEIFMGVPNDLDGNPPSPGTGYEYCWTPTATTPPMLDYASTQPDGHLDLPAGDYSAVSGFDALVGNSLNGAWTIKVVDCWGADNGFIFDWTVKFDSSLVEDCSEPIG